mgnify:CR=1 FL=1
MDVNLHLAGAGDARRAIERWVARTDTATRAAVSAAAHEIEAAAKSHFSGTHRKGQPHEGGPEPNVVTGTLRRSIIVEGPTSAGAFTWAAKVGPTTVYARAIELGLRQAPGVSYPYFGPGVADALPRVGEIFRAAWRNR